MRIGVITAFAENEVGFLMEDFTACLGFEIELESVSNQREFI